MKVPGVERLLGAIVRPRDSESRAIANAPGAAAISRTSWRSNSGTRTRLRRRGRKPFARAASEESGGSAAGPKPFFLSLTATLAGDRDGLTGNAACVLRGTSLAHVNRRRSNHSNFPGGVGLPPP